MVITDSPHLEISAWEVCPGKDLPGLAHFLEHMLFTGTKKYPKEGQGMKGMERRSGCCFCVKLNELLRLPELDIFVTLN